MNPEGTDQARGAPRPAIMLGITAAWGLCFLAIRLGLQDAPVLWFAALRALIAAAALLLLCLVQGRALPRGLRTWALITLMGLTNVTVAFAAMFAGTAGMAIGAAAVLANAQPLLIIVPAWWLYGESISARTVAGIGLGFAGLLVVGLASGGGSGVWLSLLAAAAVTAGTLTARSLAGTDLVAASAWHFLIGGALLAGTAAAREPVQAIHWTPQFLTVLLFLSLAGTAAAFLAWFTEAARSRLDLLTAWTLLVPVIGTAASLLLPGERPPPLAVAGIVLVLGSLWLVLRRPTATGPPPPRGTKASDPSRR
ncbi:DMT family transporter [Pseudarthrobacter oxydans]|uniref:DMT family transporter n=1 Tax=Pseudarthrobacter oxydans TaxID=1671 RepID=UPI0015732A34|nr:DMT family transporter [Pseudarthrobacter oxydans]NSX38518.1 DMT family transporter [Pseudarthrobacter oxydans]